MATFQFVVLLITSWKSSKPLLHWESIQKYGLITKVKLNACTWGQKAIHLLEWPDKVPPIRKCDFKLKMPQCLVTKQHLLLFRKFLISYLTQTSYLVGRGYAMISQKGSLETLPSIRLHCEQTLVCIALYLATHCEHSGVTSSIPEWHLDHNNKYERVCGEKKW